MSSGHTLYSVLQVSESAPEAVIKAAHRALMKSLHPDTGAGDVALTKAVNEAFAVLADPEKRSAYDRRLADERTYTADEGPSAGEPAFRTQDPARLAGLNVFDREPIDLASMPWYTRA